MFPQTPKNEIMRCYRSDYKMVGKSKNVGLFQKVLFPDLNHSFGACDLQHLSAPLGAIRESQMDNLSIPGELRQVTS